MFDAAARHLNFRLAADELNLTQGAVAQQVRRLEADLGYQLFDRKARGLGLTEIGRGYHNAINRGLTIIDDATRNLIPQSSTVKLSITPSFASKWLVPRLSDFACAHPDIEIQTIASESISNFTSDGVDLAIRLGHPPFAEDVYAQLLSSLDLRAVCSPEMARSIGPVETAADIIDKPLIQDSHNLWDALFEEANLCPPQRPMQFNQTTLAMAAAANGQGIALAPRILTGSDVSQNRLTVLWRDKRPQHSGYYIVYPKSQKANAARDRLIDWIFSEVDRGP